MALPLAIPIIQGATTLLGGAISFFSGQQQSDAQQQAIKDQIEYQQWLVQQQAIQEQNRLRQQKELLTYLGLAILFIVVLIVVFKSI